MAVNQNELMWSRAHFVTRLLGLLGLLTALVAVVLAHPKSFRDVVNVFTTGDQPVLYGALGAVGLALLVELIGLARVAAGRRNVFGLIAMVQVVLAAALLVGVNVFSYQHHARYDFTRDREHTLPDDLCKELARLTSSGQTQVIVYNVHKAFAGADKPDLYDAAAERKIVEKVTDIAGLLREVGPQLKVDVLDVQDKNYQDRLARLTDGKPELRQAIDRAPENSIFVVGDGRFQQMSFSELYQLDRAASQAGKGNLVLLGQGEDGRGVRPFVRRVLNLEQRRPRVGVLVIHELLTTEGADEVFTLAGLRRSLTANGFDVEDVVLKRWGGRAPEPAADTFEESKLERLEAEIESANEDIRDLQDELKTASLALTDLRIRPGEKTAEKLKELSEKYGTLFLGGKVTEAGREVLLKRVESNVQQIEEELTAKKAEREKLEKERSTYDVDQVAESRRLTDVKAKLAAAVADCDLLIIPRLTRQTATGQLIVPRLHRMSAEQAAVVRDFMKAGKPVLACLGPITEPAGMRLPPEIGPAGPDDFERALTDLGFHLGKHTVLFNADARSFVERRQDLLRQSTPVEVPPIDFTHEVPSPDPLLSEKKATGPDHELRQALRVIMHSGGKMDLRLRFPRPVAFVGKEGQGGTFLLTASGWNESRPFPSGEWRPRYTPPKPDDPDSKTLDARRRGAFSVGAAAEVPVPKAWEPAAGTKVRVAVIGQGEAFTGMRLDPARERLLLVTANWLLGRDDYLPRDDHEWRYPRLEMEPGSDRYNLWLWGTRVGLPVLFAFLGAIVLLFRHLR